MVSSLIADELAKGWGIWLIESSMERISHEFGVMKFGGTSVEDPAAIRRTAAIVAGRVAKGKSPVVVVSAMAKVTDQLLRAAACGLAGRPHRRAGHQLAAALAASRYRVRTGEEQGRTRRAHSL